MDRLREQVDTDYMLADREHPTKHPTEKNRFPCTCHR